MAVTVSVSGPRYGDFLAGLICLSVLAFPAGALSQAAPNGPDFQVNTTTTGAQRAAGVAIGSEGRFAITWTSDSSAGDDTSSRSVQAQFFDRAGRPLGGEIQVNTYTTDDQVGGRIAVDPQGNFIVVWQSRGSAQGDTSWDSVQARRFDAEGVPLGDEFQVNSITTGFQTTPAVATGPAGQFVVVWQDYGAGVHSIRARRFESDGTPLGTEVAVSSATCCTVQSPDVATDALGNFVVTWRRGSDIQFVYDVYARRYGAHGGALGSAFEVNSPAFAFNLGPKVAMAPAGEFVIAWGASHSYPVPDPDDHIRARRFAADGTPEGLDFVVTPDTSYSHRFPDVKFTAGGEFVITWSSDLPLGTDNSGYGIQARRYGPNGVPTGDAFQVNSYTTGRQAGSSVAADAEGNLVLAWSSDGSAETDVDGPSTQARRIDQLFRDGFEDGDWLRWTAAVP